MPVIFSKSFSGILYSFLQNWSPKSQFGKSYMFATGSLAYKCPISTLTKVIRTLL